MNLKQELDKKTAKKEKATENVISEVKLLLEGNQAKEKEILRNVGLDLHIQLGEQIMEKKLNIDKVSNEYKEFPVYSRESIDTLCEEYRLYFRPAKNFIGKIPADIGPVLLRMSEEHNLNLDAKAEHHKQRFFVMAPPKLFDDYKGIGAKVMEMESISKRVAERKAEERLERLNRLRMDPALFYAPMGDPENLIMVKAWGNDFNFLRRVWGFLTQTNLLSFMLTFIYSLTLLVVPVLAIIFLNNSDILYPAGLSVWQNLQEGEIGLSFMTRALAIIGQGLFVLLGIRNIVFIANTWFSKEGIASWASPFKFKTSVNKYKSKE